MMSKLWLYIKNNVAGNITRNFYRLTGRSFIEVHYDCGFGNILFLRGELPELSWNQGIAMTNIGSHHWIYVLSSPAQGHFKVLINDVIYEDGPNHEFDGRESSITPTFNTNEL